MTCAEARPLLGAYVDLELGATDAAAVAAHVAACAGCAAEIVTLRAVNASVRQAMPPLHAPDALRGRIQRALLAERASAPAAPSHRPRARRWLTRGAAAALLIAVGSVGTLVVTRGAWPTDLETATLVDRHTSAVIAHHTIDVASSDHHTVKPWFAGRIDFSPPVPTLDSAGVALLGGRVDTVATMAVAALTYRKRLHTITVFVRPGGVRDSDGATGGARGYHTVQWTDRGFWFAAVSDLNAPELAAFAESFKRGW